MQQALIERLTADLNRPKSGWQKLASAIKQIALIALGITLGRGSL